MSDTERFMSLGFMMGVQAGFFTVITIISERSAQFLIKRWITFTPRPLYFRLLKYSILFLGNCVCSWFFWMGFGIGMVAGNNESSWVMTFAYFGLWVTIPMVWVGYFIPLLGGLALIADAFWTRYLLTQVWNNPISFGAKDEIFSAQNNLYNLTLTQVRISGPILAVGILFLIFGLFEFFLYGRGKGKV